MAGAQAIVEWFKGSALRPLLAALDADGQAKFLSAYGEKIARAYQPRFDGKVLLRFPRFFIVAVR
jgi:trans-aconitate 2-methyltransferase